MSTAQPKTAISPRRDEDFPEWYQQVIRAAELAEPSDVRGCMVIRPWGYSALIIPFLHEPYVWIAILQHVIGIAVVVAAAGYRAGTTGAVTAIMAGSLPLLALRAPHAIALERALEYRPIASIEFAESVVFYGWAIATVAAGWGVWGVASAAVLRSLVGSALMTLEATVRDLGKRFGLIPEDLNLDLGAIKLL